jgi:hypothetical protein
MGSEVSAWRKVFLRNGLIWTAYMVVIWAASGTLSQPGWPLGFSETANGVVTFVAHFAICVVLTGAAACIFRQQVRWITSLAAEKGKRLPAMRWRWFWSYFLEIDEGYRLRP